jgi:hypothetical protein
VEGNKVSDWDWQDRALCRIEKIPSERFFLDRKFTRENEKTKITICKRCKVKMECLKFAVKYNCQGIWGGTDDGDRLKTYALLRMAAKPFSPSQESKLRELEHHIDASLSYPSGTSSHSIRSQSVSKTLAVSDIPFSGNYIRLRRLQLSLVREDYYSQKPHAEHKTA